MLEWIPAEWVDAFSGSADTVQKFAVRNWWEISLFAVGTTLLITGLILYRKQTIKTLSKVA